MNVDNGPDLREIASEEQEKKGNDMSLAEFGAMLETQQASVKKMSLEEMHDFAEDKLPKSLEDIANRVMSKADLRKFNVFVDMLRTEREERIRKTKWPNGYPNDNPLTNMAEYHKVDNKEIVKDEKLDTLRLAAACNLTHSVSFNEKLYGKNIPGYITEENLDPKEADKNTISNLRRVTQLNILAQEMFHKDLFGDKTKQIYDKTVSRIEMSRAKQRGLKVQDIEFPAFTQPAAVKK